MLFLSFFPLFNFKTYKDIVSVIFNLLLFCLLPCIHPLIAIVHIHVHVQVKTRYTIVSCMYIYFKHVAHITVIDTLMIQNYIVHSTLFLHRVLPATDESIRQLTGLKGTPLAHLPSQGLPVEDSCWASSGWLSSPSPCKYGTKLQQFKPSSKCCSENL